MDEAGRSVVVVGVALPLQPVVDVARPKRPVGRKAGA